MLAATVAAFAVGSPDHAPQATPVGVAFVRNVPELADWHGRVRP